VKLKEITGKVEWVLLINWLWVLQWCLHKCLSWGKSKEFSIIHPIERLPTFKICTEKWATTIVVMLCSFFEQYGIQIHRPVRFEASWKLSALLCQDAILLNKSPYESYYFIKVLTYFIYECRMMVSCKWCSADIS
jgi:hypothetical protein